MLFSHDTEQSLACAVDLVNSSCSAQLADPASLRAFVIRHAISDVGALTQRDLHEVHALSAAITAVFDSADDRSAADAVNAVLDRATVTPRLTDHDGYGWHVHYFAPGSSLAEHLTIDCGMALGHAVAAGERERLRRCDAPDCDQVLVDLSRNRSKRYCDARTCGNRLHVAAYRERRCSAGG